MMVRTSEPPAWYSCEIRIARLGGSRISAAFDDEAFGMRAVRAFLTLVFLCLALIPTAAFATDQVDLLLVFAVDVSRSIDAAKFQLQREGYAAALSSPHVVEAIQSGRNGRVGVIFVEWS